MAQNTTVQFPLQKKNWIEFNATDPRNYSDIPPGWNFNLNSVINSAGTEIPYLDGRNSIGETI